MKLGHDVFISYSNKDKTVADAICHVLEQYGITCWIAPRDVQPGVPYAREIIRGIENCQVMILIFTHHSNSSEHVANEIDEAFSNGKIIVPLLVDDTPMNKELKYYLGRKHWLVAYPDFELKFGELVQSVGNILGREVALVLPTNSNQEQAVEISRAETQTVLSTYLKILPNLSCRILIDFEEKAIAEADCLYKLPLASGEYLVQFISIDNSSDMIEKEISLIHGDVLERVDLKMIRQERQKKMEWLPYIEGGRMGLKTKETEEVVLEAIYEYVGGYSEGLISVRQDRKYGFVDLAGKLVVPCIYHHAGCYSEGLACVEQYEKKGFIDQSGKVIVPCIYDLAFGYRGGLAQVRQNGKYGFVDRTGKMVIPCIYDNADSYSDGFTRVKQNGKYGFVSLTEIISCIYDWAGSYSDGFALVKENGKFGFIDQTGKLVLPCIYDDAGDYSEGFASVKQNDKYGFIDQTGKIVISCIYDQVDSYSKGLARVRQNEKYGFIDKTGRVVVPLIYDFVVYSGSLIRVTQDRKHGFTDLNGKLVIPCIYDDAGSFRTDIAYVGKDFKYGFINKSGDLVVPFIYDKAREFSNGLAYVQQNGKRGFINQSGRLAIPCVFDEADSFSGTSFVMLNGKHGYVDYWGNFLED